MPIIQDILCLLAFALLIAGHFAAVIVVHGMHKAPAESALDSAAERRRQAA